MLGDRVVQPEIWQGVHWTITEISDILDATLLLSETTLTHALLFTVFSSFVLTLYICETAHKRLSFLSYPSLNPWKLRTLLSLLTDTSHTPVLLKTLNPYIDSEKQWIERERGTELIVNEPQSYSLSPSSSYISLTKVSWLFCRLSSQNIVIPNLHYSVQAS